MFRTLTAIRGRGSGALVKQLFPITRNHRRETFLRSFSSIPPISNPPRPPLEKFPPSETSVIKELISTHIWRTEMKPRVLLSMALMLSAKGVNVSVPFLFKNIVDNVNFELLKGTSAVPSTEVDPHAPIDTLTSLTTSLSTMTMPTLTPTTAATLAVIGYGVSRASASFLNESRNMVFAHVAQSAIRRVGSSTFEHLHLLDLNFHLKKNSGTVTRILERGNRSISFVLNAMVFNVLPTAVEVGVVR